MGSPANQDDGRARRAAEAGTAALSRLLARLDLSAGVLAEHVGLQEAPVAELLVRPRRAPLVVRDREDAQALLATCLIRDITTLPRRPHHAAFAPIA